MIPDNDQPDSALAEAIFRTLLYADIFHFPLSAAEIHHFLIGMCATPEAVEAALHQSVWLAARIVAHDGYYQLQEPIAPCPERSQLESMSCRLLKLAAGYGKLLAHLPFVRMVALTGALAMHNPRSAEDDIDYMLVTTPQRVWLARLFAVIVVRLAKLRGIKLCPNYVLAETALKQDQQDLYMAHEITQMLPLAGQTLYAAMRAENSWTADFLPNAVAPFHPSADAAPRGLGLALKRLTEFILSGHLGNWLENWERRRKTRKFRATQPHSEAAQLDDQRAKGHFQDHGAPVMQAYQARLGKYQLDEESYVLSLDC